MQYRNISSHWRSQSLPIQCNSMFLPLRLLAICLLKTCCMKPYLNYQRSRIKKVNNLRCIEFIENCRQADIIPRFLRFRIPNNGCFEPSVVLNFQRRLLKQELAKAKQQAESHKVSIDEHLKKLQAQVQERWLPSILLHIWYAVANESARVASVHQQKLNFLSKEQSRPLRGALDTVRIVDEDIHPP